MLPWIKENIHPLFRINGRPIKTEDIMVVAYNYVKEGDSWEVEIGNFLLDWLDNNESITMYTSGSTGNPKPHQISKKAMRESAGRTVDYFDLNHYSRILCCLPLRYIAGKMMIVRALYCGADVHIIQSVKNPLEKLEERFDFAAFTPMMAEASVKDLHRVKKVLIGGAPINQKLSVVLKTIDARIFESYGMTETASHVAIKQHFTDAEAYFEALDGIHFTKSKDETLVIHGLIDYPDGLKTNDLVRLLSNTQFEWLGRIDEVVNSGGIKLNIQELQKKLAAFVEEEFFLTKEPDDQLGERLVMVLKSNETPDTTKFLKVLEPYEKPKVVYATDSFVQTFSGKIDKKKSLELSKKQLSV
ncbi:MAG: AMP-binding protein [Flavobacteriaceae bacterium]|nr:AMP-binding protein [Flavobacteriaceae bacterium]